jgi:ANTAR domain
VQSCSAPNDSAHFIGSGDGAEVGADGRDNRGDACHAEKVLARAQISDRRRHYSAVDIGKAVGILMERYRLDSDRAFQLLVRTSQDSNTKLRDVAAGIITDTDHHAE